MVGIRFTQVTATGCGLEVLIWYLNGYKGEDRRGSYSICDCNRLEIRVGSKRRPVLGWPDAVAFHICALNRLFGLVVG